jgi:hypothetical protein
MHFRTGETHRQFLKSGTGTSPDGSSIQIFIPSLKYWPGWTMPLWLNET